MSDNWLKEARDALALLRAERTGLTLPTGETEVALGLAMRKLETPRYEVGVIGVQGHGKSALVNALLGEDLVYSGAEIATSRVVRISHGLPRVEVQTASGSSVGMQRYPVKALKEFGQRIDAAILPLNAEIVAYCESEFLRDGVCLVDTPGEGAGQGAESDDALVNRYLREAVVVLVAIHAAKPGLQRVFDLIQRAGRNASDVVIALTAVDLLDDDDLDEAIEATQRQLAAFSFGQVPVYSVSAFRAQRGEARDADYIRGLEQLKGVVRARALRAEAGAIEHVQIAAGAAMALWERQWADALEALEAECQACKAEQSRIEELFRAKRKELEDVRSGVQHAEDEWNVEIAGILCEEPHDLVVEIEAFIASVDIPCLNQGLATRVNELLQEAAEAREAAVTSTTREMIQDCIALTKSRGLKIDPGEPTQLSYTLPEVKIAPQPEGLSAWFKDPDDIKRKASANRRATSELTRILREQAARFREFLRERVQPIRAACHAEVDKHITQASQPLRNVEERLRGLNVRKQQLADELCRLEKVHAQVISECTRVLLLMELDSIECSGTIARAAEMLPSSSEGNRELRVLCADLTSLPAEVSTGDPQLRSYWAHVLASVFYLRMGQAAGATRQRDLAVQLEPCVPPEQQERGARRLVEALRHHCGLRAALQFLHGHALRDALWDSFTGNLSPSGCTAAALLVGDISRLRHQLAGAAEADVIPDLAEMAAYACRRHPRGGDAVRQLPLGALAQWQIAFDAESDSRRMAEFIRADPSIERHLVARLVPGSRLSSDEQALLERAYGSIASFERLLPGSCEAILERALATGAGPP